MPYEIYHKVGSSSFAGDWEQFVLVREDTGEVIAHYWTWDQPSVVHEWNHRRDGCVGQKWPKERPKGWRKMPAGYQREATLDWAIGAL